MNFTSSYTGPLKAVILDWAGTTMDYGCFSPAAVFVTVFKAQGVEITIEEARGPMGMYKKDHIRELLKMPRIRERWHKVHGDYPEEDDVEAMFQDFVPQQIACLPDYADLIPGALGAIKSFHQQGLKIGTSTGYTTDMMNVLLPAARDRGYEPDAIVCSSDVPAGRPSPFMIFQNMMKLNVYPVHAVVKVGDTIPDIQEGLNAGVWTIGVAETGNEMGMTEKEVLALTAQDRAERLGNIYDKMLQAGAHVVVDSIGDVSPFIDEINERLKDGERP